MDAGTTHHRAGQLDAIRAICVAAVIFSHTIPESYRIGEYSFFEFGAYAVYMFFVLSGFLITGQLLDTQEKRAEWGDGIGRPLRLFYGRRVLRLFPAYYLAIAGGAILSLPGIRAEFAWHAAQLSDILFAIDLVAQNNSTAGHFWSLTIEWQFYLVWPLVIFLAPARRLPWIVALTLAVSAYSWQPAFPMNRVLEDTNILQSLDSLAFGAGLALAVRRGWSFGWVKPALVLGAAAWAANVGATMLGHSTLANGLTMPAHEGANLLFAAIVYRAWSGFGGRTGALLDQPWLRYIGVISYGMYVYHEFILGVMVKAYGRLGWGDLNWGIGLSIELFVLSLIAAAISWRIMEEPVNRLRRHMRYTPPPGVPDTPALVSPLMKV